MQACSGAKTTTRCMERTFSWSESFPATTHTYAHVRTHSRPVRSCTRSCGSPLCCTWIYLWLLLLILEHIFPFRPLSVAVIVKVINDRYLHVLRLHLSRSARLTSSSADSAYRSGGQLKTAPRQEGGGGPTPESQVEDLLLLLLLLLRLPPSRYVWFAVPARTERAELNRVASADTWNQNDVSVLKWRLNGSKY